VALSGWLLFAALVLGLLALDLVVFHRRAHRESLRSAVGWSVFWIGLGLAFALVVWWLKGSEGALAYLTAFLVEKSLSIDNLFVFLALFTYFGVAEEYQHRVLFWGIIGALVTRGVFIVAGVALLEAFHWLVYVLGALLIGTGAKLLLGEGEEVHPERNLAVRLGARLLPMVKEYEGQKFVVRRGRAWRFTPMMLVLLAIESTDVMFAVDSVPAVLAVSRDIFVVYTSNIFAILGLRALYFVLAGVMRLLRYLRPALALILALIGAKMLLSEVVQIPTAWSLAAVAMILAVATLLSLVFPREPAASGNDG